LRKAFTSIAASWRAVADSAQHQRPSPAKAPLIDGRPSHYSGVRR
jgi:hypothetical protein